MLRQVESRLRVSAPHSRVHRVQVGRRTLGRERPIDSGTTAQGVVHSHCDSGRGTDESGGHPEGPVQGDLYCDIGTIKEARCVQVVTTAPPKNPPSDHSKSHQSVSLRPRTCSRHFDGHIRPIHRQRSRHGILYRTDGLINEIHARPTTLFCL